MTGPVYYFVWLIFGTIYPAYASFKAVKSKNAKHYVRWMMYWIVYAIFTATESIFDPFLQFWLPFYAEAKVIFLIYLISSSTRGSTVIYRGWIHPALCSNEAEIDVAIEKLKLKSFQTAKRWIKTGIQKIGGIVTNTALRGGGGLVQQLQRSYSMVDLTEVGNQKLRRRSTIHEISEDDENNTALKSGMKQYRSEQCLYNPSPNYSSLRRWRSPETFLSNESMSSGYSTDSLLPSYDDLCTQFDQTTYSKHDAAHIKEDENLKWEAQLEEMMVAMRKSKRRIEGSFQGEN